MDDIWVIVGTVVGAVIVLAIIHAVRSSSRSRELQAWCKSNHLSFDPARSNSPGVEFKLCGVMQQGLDRLGQLPGQAGHHRQILPQELGVQPTVQQPLRVP